MRRPLAALCEARLDVCEGRATARHHLRLRSQGGVDGPTLDCCRACHQWIHDHPAFAYERGLLLRTQADAG